MTINEMRLKIKQLEKEFDLKKKAVIEEYCTINNPYQTGDVFEDHIGKIKIDGFAFSYGSQFSNPCCVYTGIVLKKDGSPKKDSSRRAAWQSNDVVKLTSKD